MKGSIIGILFVLLLISAAIAKVGGDDVTLEVKGAGNVVFSHDAHVSTVGLKCTECHASLFVTKEKDKKVSMAEMQKGKSCGACHNGKQIFSVKGNCNKCHQR